LGLLARNVDVDDKISRRDCLEGPLGDMSLSTSGSWSRDGEGMSASRSDSKEADRFCGRNGVLLRALYSSRLAGLLLRTEKGPISR
jgi:hypothetical protein